MYFNMRQRWIILLLEFMGLSCVLTTDARYPAEVLVPTTDTVHKMAFIECAENLDIKISFGNARVSLQLRHNPEASFDLVPTILLDDRQKISSPNVPVRFPQSVCFYQDTRSSAAVMVKSNQHSVLVQGQFSFRGIRYNIEPPADDKSNHEVTVVGPDIHYLTKESFTRLKRAAKKHYIVQVLVFVDYYVYKRWYDKTEVPTIGTGEEKEAKRREQTQESIKYYFSNIINDMDLRYNNIESSLYDIKISLSGFVIATTPSASSWVEKHKEVSTDDRDKLWIDESLKDFTEWVNQHNDQLPENDAAMLFTGLDLYKKDQQTNAKEYKQVGQANVGTVCQYNRTSIVEDTGKYTAALIAAHELAHNLGAKHDGQNNNCSISDHYIMIPMSGDTRSENYTNIYRFSDCSVREMWNTVSKPRSQCLLTTTAQYNQTAYSLYIAERPGQKLSVHQQCQAVFGKESYYCGTKQLIGQVCRSLACHQPSDDTCYILGDTPAFMGTTCGSKKWCFQGNCIIDERAPAVDEQCMYGDFRGLLSSKTSTCSQVVAKSPRMCYVEDNYKLCCDSCAKAKNPSNPGCEYGDQADWCSSIERKDCYLNDKICCETCSRLRKSNTPGCEYGDVAAGCSVRGCQLFASNIPICCSTCFALFVPPSTTTTLSTTTSSITTTAENFNIDNQVVEVDEPDVDIQNENNSGFIPENEKTVTENTPANGAKGSYLTLVMLLYALTISSTFASNFLCK